MADDRTDERERDHRHDQRRLRVRAEDHGQQEVHPEQSHQTVSLKLVHELGLAFRLADRAARHRRVARFQIGEELVFQRAHDVCARFALGEFRRHHDRAHALAAIYAGHAGAELPCRNRG
jgi:hypothetical protein